MPNGRYDIPGAAEGEHAKVWIEQRAGVGWKVYYLDPTTFDPNYRSLATVCVTHWGARIAASRLLRKLRAGLSREEFHVES